MNAQDPSRVGGHVYRCAYGRGHGTVDMKTALEQSCNCYFVQQGLRLGAQTVYDITKVRDLGKASRLRAVCGQPPGTCRTRRSWKIWASSHLSASARSADRHARTGCRDDEPVCKRRAVCGTCVCGGNCG